MNETERMLTIRLLAVEHLLTHLLLNRFRQDHDPVALAKKFAAAVHNELSRATMPKLDPVMADDMTAEIADATDILLQQAIQQLEREKHQK